jgi:hypothetical protein
MSEAGNTQAERRQQQAQQQQMQSELNQQFAAHVYKTTLRLPFPAGVSSAPPSNGTNDSTGGETSTQQQSQATKPLRTDDEFIQLRLLENGVLFDDMQTVGQITECVSSFIADMERTGCYTSVRVAMDKGQSPQKNAPQEENGGKVSVIQS